jgi:hypothetical protein
MKQSKLEYVIKFVEEFISTNPKTDSHDVLIVISALLENNDPKLSERVKIIAEQVRKNDNR